MAIGWTVTKEGAKREPRPKNPGKRSRQRMAAAARRGSVRAKRRRRQLSWERGNLRPRPVVIHEEE